MLLRNDQQIALNQIETLCIETADHYANAADHADDEELAHLFGELAQQRKQFIAELADHIRALDDLPQHPDPDRETVDELLTSIKGFFSGDSRDTLIDERKKLEQDLAQSIRAGLGQDLPADTKILLRQLLEHAESTIHRLEQVKR